MKTTINLVTTLKPGRKRTTPSKFIQWIGLLKVGQKISLGYGIALSVSVLGTLSGLVIADNYQKQNLEAQADALQEIQIINYLKINELKTRTKQQQLISYLNNPQRLREESNHLRKFMTEFKQSWVDLQVLETKQSNESGDSEEEIKLFKRFVRTYQGVPEGYIKELEKLLESLDIDNTQPKNLEVIRDQLINFNSSAVTEQIENFSDDLTKIVDQSALEYKKVPKVLAVQILRSQIIAGSLLLSVIIATLLAYHVSQAIVNPLQNLTKEVQLSIRQGNFDQQIRVEFPDEVGVLATSFNQLIQFMKSLLLQQQEAKQKLEMYSQNLEEKVAERTNELEENNQRLKATLKKLHQTQAQMVQSEKMSALGQMVAGIAHEINNPINFIHGNLKHLDEYSQDLLRLLQSYQEHYPNPPETLQAELDEIELDFVNQDLVKVIQSMRTGTGRIQEIVKSLRNFSRLDEAEFKEVDIHEGIDNTLMILQHRLKAKSDFPEIQVIKEYAQLPLVECYAGQLNQVFMNLLANAIDALEEARQGYLFSQIIDKPSIITIGTEMYDQDSIRITIADNGVGIPEDIITKLFDPFFTTKPIGKGTGLGLSISYQIITEKHRGRLWCDSKIGEGSKFMIEIPIRQDLSILLQ
ncbi:MAG TPA: ATP-binding protein [Nostocaceae cyanobacterium]|nr:ATP-binding protein [Nostocaceae cyanobacterium]